MERRLATILAADVTGYSRLVEADEEGTLKMLSAYRTLIDGLVSEHRGRVFGSAGDSVIAEFASPVEAVRCAVEAQRQLAERNTDLPEDRRIEFRIGVNLGDVVVEGDNLMGDAVNVAARLQELSEPGGIHVSASVFDQVEGKLDLAFNDLGAQQVKNIVKPVRVYQVPLGEITGGGAKGSGAPPSLPDKPSIAVLPFTNMSGDIEHEYFSDGISEDVITDLSRISGLFVISRSSSFTFKGRSVDLRDISRDLGARYIVEGSVRRAGDRVRITAQLVDGTTGGHLWAERYDRDLADIFAVQDDVTKKIVTALKLRLTVDEKHRLLVRGTSNVEAYEHVLRGREFLFRDTPADNIRARESFDRSLSLDPGYAEAWMLLGETHLAEFNMGWDLNPDSTLDVAHHLMSKALELGPDLPSAHTSLGKVLVWQKKHGQALASIERSIELDPNDAEGYGYLAFVLNWAGRPKEAIAHLEKAQRLNPVQGGYLFFRGQAYFGMGQYEDSIRVLRQGLIRSDEIAFHYLLAAIYGRLGRKEEATLEAAEIERLNPGINLSRLAELVPYKHVADRDRLIDGLREAGVPE